MPMIRTPPSGPALVGNADGDLLRWNSSTNEWLPIGGSSYLNVTEFDYIISSRADLVGVVAPVGGQFDLPSGSYFFKSMVSLDDGDRVVVDGTDVLLMASPGSGMSGNYADDQPWLSVEGGGSVVAYNVEFLASVASRHGVSVDAASSFVAVDSVIESTASGAQAALSANGTVTLQRCRLGGGVRALEMASGFVQASNCAFRTSAGALSVLLVAPTAEAQLDLSACSVLATQSGTANLLLAIGSAGVPLRLNSSECTWERQNADTAGLRLEGAGDEADVTLFNSWVRAPAPGFVNYAILAIGQLRDLHIVNCDFDGHTLALLKSGTDPTNTLRFVGNHVRDGNGVNWAAADLPTNGTFEFQNFFEGANAFLNHAKNDAGVCRRANTLSGVLQGETIITP